MLLVSERPRVDHPVDRPELYEPKRSEVTGTNGRTLDRFYRYSSVARRAVDECGSDQSLTNQKVVSTDGRSAPALPQRSLAEPLETEVEPRFTNTPLAGRNRPARASLVATPAGSHPFPFRTRPLSPRGR